MGNGGDDAGSLAVIREEEVAAFFGFHSDGKVLACLQRDIACVGLEQDTALGAGGDGVAFDLAANDLDSGELTAVG